MKLFNIKKHITPLLIILLMIPGSSCLVEGDLELVVATSYSDSWPITELDGEWEETITITYDDVVSDIDLEDVTIKRVDIEAIGFNVQGAPASLNGVKDVFVKVKVPALSDSVNLVENVALSKVAESDTVYVADELVEAGVLLVKEKFEGYLFNTDFDSFTLTTTGESDPEGTPLNMDLAVIIKLSVVTVETVD